MNKQFFHPFLLILVILGMIVSACTPRSSVGQEEKTGITWAKVPPIDTTLFAESNVSRNFSFPKDHGPHPDFLTEWWYFTGNLNSDDGKYFGYQLTFFRRAIQPEVRISGRESNMSVNQVYMAHFAITEISDNRFSSHEKFSRGDGISAGAISDPYLFVWLNDWTVSQTSEGSFYLKAREEDVSIDLILKDQDGVLLQGENGLSRKSINTASYYYSMPRIVTDGSIIIEKKEYKVSGLSWMDHEFSTGTLAEGQIGWDWFSLHLDNGNNLMVYSMRLDDGSIDPYSHGSISTNDQKGTFLQIEDYKIFIEDTWISPKSGAEYPSSWRLEIPTQRIDLQIIPAIKDQELNLSFTYWEGAVRVEGYVNGKPVKGSGYVELTGYAHSMQGRF